MTIWSSEIKELEKLHQSVREAHPKLDKELSRLVKTDDENMALVYARRCLEIIISDLCERELNRPRGSEPLQGIIDKLNREEKVPPHIIGSMKNINSISTFGAHPKEFDPKQVKPVLMDLATALGWYVTYTEERGAGMTDVQARAYPHDDAAKDESIRSKKKLDSRSIRFRLNKLLVLQVAVSVLLLLAIVLIWRLRSENKNEDNTEYLPLSFEEPFRYRNTSGPSCVLSPAGDKIAYRGPSTFYIYELSDGSTNRIPEPIIYGNNCVTFSPSGDSVVVRTGSYLASLYVVSLSDGQSRTITDSVSWDLASWSEDGWIYYRQSHTSNVMRVKSDGSRKEKVIEKSDDIIVTGHVVPLPGDDGLIYPQHSEYNIDPAASEIIVFNTKTKEKKSLGNGIKALFIESYGVLIICKSDGTLLAGRFDVDNLTPASDFVKVLENVETGGINRNSVGSFSVSNDGDLLFVTRDEIVPDEILFADRSGRIMNDPVTLVGLINDIDLSSDGNMVAAQTNDYNIGNPNIWIKDLRDGTLRRISTGKSSYAGPSFINQDSAVTFISLIGNNNWDLYVTPLDGSRDASLFFDRTGDIYETTFTKDGKWMAFSERNALGEYDIFAHSFGKDSVTFDVASSPADESAPSISPDGKWIAYVSTETTRHEVYVQPFPLNDNKSRWQISKDGGTKPVWSNSGSELFFLEPDNDLVSVPVSDANGFNFGTPRTLFNTVDYEWSGEITPDGDSFLLIKRDLHAPGQVILVKNWMEEVMRKLAGK